MGIICTLGETFVWPVLYFIYILFHKDWRLLYLQQNYCPFSVLLSSLYSLPKVNGNCFDMYKILYAIGTKIWYVLGTKFFRLSIWIMYQNTLFPWLKKCWCTLIAHFIFKVRWFGSKFNALWLYFFSIIIILKLHKTGACILDIYYLKDSLKIMTMLLYKTLFLRVFFRNL